MSDLLDQYYELLVLLGDAEPDADKASRGMRAAGVRLRRTMKEAAALTVSIRASVLDCRESRGSKACANEHCHRAGRCSHGRRLGGAIQQPQPTENR